MVQQTVSSSTDYTIPCQQAADGSSIILPLPSLDHVACTKFPFYDMVSQIDINPNKYNDLFSFVETGDNTVHSTTIAFLALMIIMAVGFIGILIFYCTSLKKIEDDNDDNELKQMLR
jgi:hypothetical protein